MIKHFAIFISLLLFCWTLQASEGEKMTKSYYSSGALYAETIFKNGKLASLKHYYESGKIREEAVHHLEDDETLIRGYYENGALQSEGKMKDNQWIGTLKRYYENGKLEQERIFDDQYLISEKNYREDGSLHYEETKDFLKVHNPQGKILQLRIYKNGRQDVEEQQFYESGKLQSEEHTKNGEGFKKIFFENGRLKTEIKLKNDQAAHIREYDSNGFVIFDDDIRDGGEAWLNWNQARKPEAFLPDSKSSF